MSASTLSQKWAARAPELRSVLRIVAAFMFILAGTTKLFGFPIASKAAHISLLSQVGIGGVLETFGGALLLIGLFTRPVAFLLAGEMAVAYFQFHAPKSFWPVVNGGSSAALYSLIWLYFSAAGPGPWSVDAKMRG